jgi:hypothetical protein
MMTTRGRGRPPTGDPMIPVSLHMPRHLIERAKDAIATEKTNFAKLMRDALDSHLDKLRDSKQLPNAINSKREEMYTRRVLTCEQQGLKPPTFEEYLKFLPKHLGGER